MAFFALAQSGCLSGVVWFGKSPDRAREIQVIQDLGGQHVRVEGMDGKSYRGIGVEAISWSPDGAKLAYPARSGSGWIVVVDGKEGPVADGIGEIAWSPDSKHISYSIERKGRWIVVRDGREEAALAGLRARSLRFSADGAHLVYVGEEDEKVVAVVDGMKTAAFDAIGHFVFGAGGKWAFAGRRGKASFLVTESRESAPYEDIADLAFSADGARLAWTARRDGGWWVFNGTDEQGPFTRVSKLVWAPRGEAMAFGVGQADGERVVRGRETGPLYEGVLPGSLAFDDSGEHFLYAARRPGGWRAIVDGVESAPYEDVETPVFVGKSSAAAFLARRGEATFVVVDGHSGPVVADATGLALSPDGRRYLHAARTGQRVEVIEGEITGGPCGQGRCSPRVVSSRVHDTVVGGTLVWGDGGAHYGYLAGHAASRRLYVVVDGEERAGFSMDELMAGVSLHPDLAGALMGNSTTLGDWVRAEVNLASTRRPDGDKTPASPLVRR